MAKHLTIPSRGTAHKLRLLVPFAASPLRRPLTSNVSSLNMTTPQEKAKLSAKILVLFNSGEIEQIEELVRRYWIVFPELAEPVRDNDEIAFAAVSSDMQIGHAMSDRLRKNVSFFVRAFDAYNAFRKVGPISITAPRDLFFILLFAQYCCHYGHLIGEAEVAELFKPRTIEEELDAAIALKELIYSLKSWSDVGSPAEETCIRFFVSKAPGFADTSYRYAYMWLSRNMTFNDVFG